MPGSELIVDAIRVLSPIAFVATLPDESTIEESIPIVLAHTEELAVRTIRKKRITKDR
jgi:hypothetical protein